MVDIERKGLTLDDWTKGISVDEYAGGSYFFSDGIQSGYNTKGFKLGNRLFTNILNYRENGNAVALVPNNTYGMLALTKDGKVEGIDMHNGSENGGGDTSGGGALYASYDDGTFGTDYLNGLNRGEYVIGIRSRRIDLLKIAETYTPANELLTEPKFDNGGAAWTIGTGWTIGDSGAEHTPGNTGTLEATINDTIDANTRVRVAIKIKDCTDGYVKPTIGLNGLGETDEGQNGWFVFTIKGYSGPTTLTITPSSDFDGTVEIVNVHFYDLSNVETSKATLSYGQESDKHPAIIWGGDLYVGCGHRVNIVNLTDRGTTTKSLVDKNYEIVSITQQAGNLILWATDGHDSKQYYWNGVDRIASEIIEWKGLVIKGVVGTETLSYVLTTAGRTEGTITSYEYRLYVVSGYQRSLMANKLYFGRGVNYDSKYYHKEKKFHFNDVRGDEAMTIFLDSLYIPGCDGIYKYGSDIPGVKSTFTRPFKYGVGATNIVLGQDGNDFFVGLTLDGVNYVNDRSVNRYLSSGYIVSNSIYWDKLSTRKTLEKLKIGYKNLASEDGGINIYAIVDDDYFWRFEVSGVTTRPGIGDVYTVAHQVKAEVINVDKTNKIITFRTTENKGGYEGMANDSLSKVSGDGDSSITVVGFDNMCLVKEIKSDVQGYGSDLIFGKDFVDTYMPYWHKMQLVIELYNIDTRLTPEVYEISIASDISDTVI